MYSVSLFATRSPEGQDLESRFTYMMEKTFGLSVQVYHADTQTDLLLACLNDDIVVFDATREAAGLHNYPAAIEQPKMLDYVYVVSRNYLPQNFFGVHEGGAPIYPNSFKNDDLLIWLQQKMQERLNQPLRTKPTKFTLETMERRQKELANYSNGLLQEALTKKDEQDRQEGRIFISYRGKYESQVRELGRRIEQGEFHQGKSKKVRIIGKGEMAYDNELLTAQRRWSVLSMIDRIIVPSTEFWIYGTENYLDSWWTRGELITLFYSLKNSTAARARLRYYDPANHQMSPVVPEIYQSTMTEAQHLRMARWYANCDPLQMGPEAVEQMRQMRTIVNALPNWLSGGISKLLFREHGNIGEMQQLLKSSLPEGLDIDEAFEKQKDINFMKSYYNDPVWDTNFWENSLLQCRCSTHSHNVLDLEGFLWLKDPLHIEITPTQLEKALREGVIACPKPDNCPNRQCSAMYRIETAAPRYLWLGTRMGKHSDGVNPGLRELPTYLAIPMERE